MCRFGADTSGAALIYAAGSRFISGEEKNRQSGYEVALEESGSSAAEPTLTNRGWGTLGAEISRKLVNEEGGGFAEEEGELVVVDPVAGAGDFDQAAMEDGLVAGIVFREREKAFESPEEQRGAGDLGEKLDGIFHVMAVRRNGAGVIIEFPEQRAVGLPIGAVQGEVAGDFVGEPRVRFFHAGH